MTAYFKSDRGKVRPINEDAGGVFKHPSGQLLTVIADGMGGHNAGDVASQMAISQLLKDGMKHQRFHLLKTRSLGYSKQSKRPIKKSLPIPMKMKIVKEWGLL